jgi:hypothetical protein
MTNIIHTYIHYICTHHYAKAVSFARAVHTGDGQTTIGVANYAVHHLGDEKEGYTGAIRRLLREQSSGGASDHEGSDVSHISRYIVFPWYQGHKFSIFPEFFHKFAHFAIEKYQIEICCSTSEYPAPSV